MLNRLLTEFAAKVETTKGTLIAMTGSDAAMNVFDSEILDNTQMLERRSQGGYFRLPHVAGAYNGAARCNLDLCGSGASGGVPLWATTLLASCGMKNTAGSFAPTLDYATDQTAISCAKYLAGKVRRLAGAMGTFTITAQNGTNATLPNIAFEHMGIFSGEADVSLITPTRPTVKPSRGITTFTINGTAVCIGTLNFALNATVVMLPCSTASGHLSAAVVDFNPEWTVNPLESLVSASDWLTGMRDATEYDLVATFGASANNTVTLTANNTGLIGREQLNEENVAREGLRFSCRNGFTLAFA